MELSQFEVRGIGAEQINVIDRQEKQEIKKGERITRLCLRQTSLRKLRLVGQFLERVTKEIVGNGGRIEELSKLIAVHFLAADVEDDRGDRGSHDNTHDNVLLHANPLTKRVEEISGYFKTI